MTTLRLVLSPEGAFIPARLYHIHRPSALPAFLFQNCRLSEPVVREESKEWSPEEGALIVAMFRDMQREIAEKYR